MEVRLAAIQEIGGEIGRQISPIAQHHLARHLGDHDQGRRDHNSFQVANGAGDHVATEAGNENTSAAKEASDVIIVSCDGAGR